MLHTLPVEILVNIARFLDVEDESVGYRPRPNHGNLRRCSRHFYEIFTPLWLRDIRIQATESISSVGFEPVCHDVFPVIYLTRLIVQNPRFAGFVRSFRQYARPARDLRVHFSPIEPAPSRADYERIVQTAGVSQPDCQKWLDDLLVGTEDACMALLLVQLRNLEALELEIPAPERCPHLTRVIQRAAEPGPCGYFSRLLSASLRGCRPLGHNALPLPSQLTFPWLVPFFQIPSIRRLQTGEISNMSSLPIPVGSFDRESSLTMIDFRELREIPAGFPELLNLCRRLESFKWELKLEPFLGTRDPFDVASLYLPLKNASSTLRTLSLTMDPSGIPVNYIFTGYPESWFFGLLLDFGVLENLHMDMRYLFLFHERIWRPAMSLVGILPRSLRVLHITDICVQLIPALVDDCFRIVGHHDSHFPRLTNIKLYTLGLYGPQPHADWTEYFLGEEADNVPQWVKDLVTRVAPKVLALKEAFRNIGVRFEIVSPYEGHFCT